MMSKKEFTRKAKEVLLNIDFIEGIPLFNSKDFDDYEISDNEGSMMLTEFLDDFYELLFESQKGGENKCQESQ